jgi:hypothetical protein
VLGEIGSLSGTGGRTVRFGIERKNTIYAGLGTAVRTGLRTLRVGTARFSTRLQGAADYANTRFDLLLLTVE